MSYGVKALEPRLVRELLNLLILQALCEKPMCGFEAMAFIQRKFGVVVGSCRVYPLLHKLEENGYIQGPLGSGGSQRKVYALTPKGLTFLNIGRDALRTFVGKLLETGLIRPVEAIKSRSEDYVRF